MPGFTSYGAPNPLRLLKLANTWTAAQTLNDDIALQLGTGGTVSLIYETADANANALLFVAPEGGATDVPVFVFGDASILNVDLTWFNGATEPLIAVVNDAGDAYVSLDAGDDAVAASKGLYFKTAADEDIELINLSVTGTPRFYWDESEDQFRFSKGIVFDAACDVQGTWVATAAWTLPAFNAGGDITLGAYLLKTTNLAIKEVDSTSIGIRDAADTAYRDFYARTIIIDTGGTFTGGDAWILRTNNADNNYVAIQSRDNGVGLVETARLVSAADPHIRIGRDDTGVALNAVTDMLVLRAGGGTGNEAANFGLGISMLIGNAASQVEERGSVDLVLVTATDGAEDVRLDWNLMAGGAMNLAMQLSGTGVLDVDASSGLGAATVGLFDDYDDAVLLRQGISEKQMEVLEQIGVVRKKQGGSGWFLNIQAMLYLLAGGIYQTREKVDGLAGRLAQLERALPIGGTNA